MLCQECHKSLATARYAEVVDGKVTDLNLCSACLNARQGNDIAGFELSAPVTPSRLSTTVIPDELARGAPRVCTSCGMLLMVGLATGEMGCGACYESFADALTRVLTDLHGSAVHLGKSPRCDDWRVELRASLQTKRALLRSAVHDESYEQAATLRDEIRRIESELATAESR